MACAPKDCVPNVGGVAVGTAVIVDAVEPFKFLPNENAAIDCALVVVVTIVPNDVFKVVLLGAFVPPKLKPPAAVTVFATSEVDVAVAARVEETFVGVAGFPKENPVNGVVFDVDVADFSNENAGNGEEVGTIFSVFFVFCESFKFAADFDAIRGDGVVIVLANENPPSGDTASLNVTEFVVGFVVDAAVAAFTANEIVGLVCSPNVGRGVLFGNATALFSVDVSIVAIGIDFIALDTSVMRGTMFIPTF